MQPTHTAGDTFRAELLLPAYPASAGWVGKLRLAPRAAGGTVVTLDATAFGDTHVWQASAVVTANWAAGVYTRVRWVERGAESYTVDQDEFTVAPNPRALAAGADLRSLPQRTLDDLIAARAAWAVTQGRTRRYKIADREREFATSAELDAEIRFWQVQLIQEQAAARLAAGHRPRNNVFVRFSRPR